MTKGKVMVVVETQSGSLQTFCTDRTQGGRALELFPARRSVLKEIQQGIPAAEVARPGSYVKTQ